MGTAKSVREYAHLVVMYIWINIIFFIKWETQYDRQDQHGSSTRSRIRNPVSSCLCVPPYFVYASNNVAATAPAITSKFQARSRRRKDKNGTSQVSQLLFKELPCNYYLVTAIYISLARFSHRIMSNCKESWGNFFVRHITALIKWKLC